MCLINNNQRRGSEVSPNCEECKAQRRFRTPILIESNSSGLPIFSVSFVGFLNSGYLKTSFM